MPSLDRTVVLESESPDGLEVSSRSRSHCVKRVVGLDNGSTQRQLADVHRQSRKTLRVADPVPAGRLLTTGGHFAGAVQT